MSDSPERDDSAGIKETDIVFDCPHCSKSLAIDYRGAGLTIPCTDCGRQVGVPIPEGMQLSDIDSTEEEQEIRILNLRRSLEAAQYRIRELESQIRELTARRESLEKRRTQNLSRFGDIYEKIGIIQNSVRTINDAASGIAQIAEDSGELIK